MDKQITEIKVFEIASLLVGAKLVMRIIDNEKITKEDVELVKKQLKLLEQLASLQDSNSNQ